MSAKFFGEYLLENKVISADTLQNAIKIQQASNLMLGELAVANQFINQQQADEINFRQQRENKRFGDIAKELGLINRNQLETLLNLQRENYKFIGDVLVELEALTLDKLTQLLVAYESEKKQSLACLFDTIKNHPLAEYLTTSIDTTNRIFLRLLHEKSQVSELIEPTQALPRYAVICKINLETSPAISITLATHLNTAKIVASKFTLQPIEDCDTEFAIDAFGEFLNIIVGHLIEESDLTKNVERSATELNINLDNLCQNANDILLAKIESQIGDLLIVINQ